MKPTKRPQAAQVAFAKKAADTKADNADKAKASALISTPGLLLAAADEAPDAAPAHEHDRERVHAPRGPPCAQGIRLLDKAEVLAIANVSFPTVWAWMRAGTFPRSRVAGGKSVWLSSEIEAWIAGLPVRRLKGDKPEAAARLNVGGTR